MQKIVLTNHASLIVIALSSTVSNINSIYDFNLSKRTLERFKPVQDKPLVVNKNILELQNL